LAGLAVARTLDYQIGLFNLIVIAVGEPKPDDIATDDARVLDTRCDHDPDGIQRRLSDTVQAGLQVVPHHRAAVGADCLAVAIWIGRAEDAELERLVRIRLRAAPVDRLGDFDATQRFGWLEALLDFGAGVQAASPGRLEDHRAT